MAILNETTYVDKAEHVIDELKQPYEKEGRMVKPQLVTTSKIRNILSMAGDIYDKIMQENSPQLSQDIRARIEYLRVRIVYESGREPTVKSFVKKAQLLECIKEIGKEKKDYLLFYHYLEALVAFHRYKGGKDN